MTDGNNKLKTSICAAKEGRDLWTPELGLVYSVCTHRPVEGSTFCKEHLAARQATYAAERDKPCGPACKTCVNPPILLSQHESLTDVVFYTEVHKRNYHGQARAAARSSALPPARLPLRAPHQRRGHSLRAVSRPQSPPPLPSS